MIRIRIAAWIIPGLSLLLPLEAAAQRPPALAGNWGVVRNLEPNTQLRVVKVNGEIVAGYLQCATDSQIVLFVPGGKACLPQDQIRRVFRLCPGPSVRRSILNLGILAGSVAAAVVLSKNYRPLTGVPLGMTYAYLCVSRPTRTVLIYEASAP